MPHFWKYISSRRPRILFLTYRCGVVGLTEVSINATGRSGVDDAAILLLEEVWPRCLSDLVSASKVDVHNLIPHLIIHIGKGLVAQDASVVDDNINTAICIDSSLDDSVSIFCRCLHSECLSTKTLNLLDNRFWVYKIVDDDRCTEFGEC